LAGVEDSGIADKVYDSLSVCEMDNFVPLVQTIILTGGTTMFPGLSTRMYKELSEIMTKTKYKGDASRVAKTGMTVHDPPRRKHAVFIGASFLANNAEESQWISKAEW
jgi:actin-related protein 2